MAEKKKSSLLEKLVPLLLVLSVGLAFIVGVLWQRISSLGKNGTSDKVVNTAKPQGPQAVKLSKEQVEKIPKVDDTDHVLGGRDVKVFLIEYSDLECPFCKRFHPNAQSAIDSYEGKVSWVYRHFPLDFLHSKARPEAEAAECAKDQGGNEAFWKFIDKLYEVTPSNNGLNLDELPQYANEVGLNGNLLKTCMDSEKYKDFVEKQYQGGTEAGVTGTPAIFVINDKGDGWLFPGAASTEMLKSMFEDALK
jgi:protein-disulfide isomerase